MSIAFLLLIAALICFVLDVVLETSRINLQSVGLACVAGAMLAGAGMIG